jgi:hypothetical protein
MRASVKTLILSLTAAALAAPVSAASMGGGSGGKSGAGSPAMNSGSGGVPSIWVPDSGPQGGGGFVGGGESVGGHVTGGGPHTGLTGGALTAPQGAPRVTFGQPGKWVAGQSGGQDDWRRHHHHRPGPVYGYSYFNNGYSPGPDFNQCWVYKKIYNSRGQFIGWRHVDICTG